jgi:hypothetical protein
VDHSQAAAANSVSKGFAWHPYEVSPEDLLRHGEEYWRDFHENCLIIRLVCQK